MDNQRIVLGLLGGIGSGKSHVAALLSQLTGAEVVDADQLAHEALDACAREGRLEKELGAQFVAEDGGADRAALAAQVFSNPPLLRRLERLTHPKVMALVKESVQAHRRSGGTALLVLDVPLLLEVGLDRRCDVLWFVDAPESVRMQRAEERGLSAEDAKKRERNQSPLERKRERADLIIRNDVDDEELIRQVRAGLVALGVGIETQV